MHFFLFLLINLLKSDPYEGISTGTIDAYCDDSIIQQMYDDFEEWKKQCQSNPALEDCEMSNYDMQFSNGKDMNKFISSFSEKTTDIYLMVFGFNGEIDFNGLKTKKNVTLLGYPEDGESNECSLIFDESTQDQKVKGNKGRMLIKKILKDIKNARTLSLKPKLAKTDSKTKPNELSNKRSTKEIKIQLVGNIRDKVPFLVLFYGNYEIVKSDLNCENVYIVMISLLKGPYKIKSNHFLQKYYSETDDGESQKLTSDHIQVGEYSMVFEDDYSYIAENIRISCHDTYAKILYGQESMYIDLGFTFSYDMMDKFGLVTVSKNIDIYKSDETISQVKNINITILPYVNIPGSIEEEEEGGGSEVNNHQSLLAKEVIKITETNWENSNIKPNITFILDKEIYEIDKSEIKTLIVDEKSFDEVSKEDNNKNDNNKDENTKGNDDKKDKNKTGMIVGIVVACVVVVVVVVVVIVVVLKKKKGVQNSSS